MRKLALDWRAAILAAYTVLTAIAMIVIAERTDPEWYLTAILFLAFAVAPVALLCLMPDNRRAFGLGAAISAAFGAWQYIETAWFAHPDQIMSGLVFVAVPVGQFVFALIWLGIVRMVGSKSKKD